MSERIKILMIDDEIDLGLMVKANLEDVGNFDVVMLDRPEEAEGAIRREQPDVILLDVVMPGRPGTEVAAALKKDPYLKRIPIIMVSGKGEMVYDKQADEFRWLPNTDVVKHRGDLPQEKGAEALAEAYGVEDYVSKPFSTELLVEVINEVVAKARKRNAQGAEPPQEA